MKRFWMIKKVVELIIKIFYKKHCLNLKYSEKIIKIFAMGKNAMLALCLILE